MKKNNKKTKLFSLIFLILFGVYFQTIAYSAIASNLTITGDAVARIRSNVRINKFKIYEVSDGVISSYEDFSKTYTMSNVTLPYSDSYIIYELVIGNYEDVEMQLSNITGLNSNLTYELIDYNLHDMICDNTNKCFGGAEKTFYLKIKYSNYNASGTNYNINLNYEFKEFSNKLMIGSSFKGTIPSTATYLVFTDEKPSSGVTLTDVSADQDMGVVGYLDGTTYKVSTRRTGIMPEANADSSYMFNGSSLTNVDLSNLNTSKVTNLEGLFKDCISLTYINFGSNWNTKYVTNMKYVFENCSGLTTVDLSKFNTINVKAFNGFVRGCTSLISLDVSNLDTSNSTSFSGMFKDCILLEVIDVSNFNTSKSTNFNNMFQNCHSVLELDISGFDTSSANVMDSMFAGCYLISTLDVSNFNTSKVSNMQGLFRDCENLTSIDVRHFDVSKVTSLYSMFTRCLSLKELDLSNWDVSSVNVSYWVFEGCKNLIYLNLSNWHFKKEVSLSGMFHGISNIEYIDLTNFTVDNVTNASSMFRECRNLREIDISGINFQNNLNISSMFYNCMQLRKIYVGENWIIQNGVESTDMFYNCVNLTNFNSTILDVSKAYVGDGGYLSRLSNVSIDGVTYQYEEGMTWGEWVDSSYDTRGFVNNNDLIYTDDLTYALVYEVDNGSYTSYSWPYATDLIDSNLVYVTFNEAGEDGEW